MLNLLIVVPALLPFLIYSYIAQSKENVENWIGFLTLLPAAIYMFPAIVATTEVFKLYEENATKGVFKEFFKALFRNFFKSLLISIVLFLILFILLADFKFNNFQFLGVLLYFINNLTDIYSLFGLAITISFLMIGLFVLCHMPLILVYFDGISLWQQFKLAFIMAFRKIGLTIIMALIVLGFAFVCIFLNLQIVIFIFGISLPIFLIVKITFKEYIKIYRKVENKENEKNDKIV